MTADTMDKIDALCDELNKQSATEILTMLEYAAHNLDNQTLTTIKYGINHV